MAEHGLQAESAVLICRPYQQRRAYATCRQVWPELEVLCASDTRSFDDYIEGMGDRHFVINMIVGDTQRIMEYPKLGHAVAQDVPGPIEVALERLIAAGFTDRLLSTAERTR
jgi:hypothetical protein